mmetsp:Transcript_31043/g.45434  ORF Transcript_31043/g.45434 Transcript_31043/m.45434 type:complete len:83 (-) Transcript_31043:1096-1344(-)
MLWLPLMKLKLIHHHDNNKLEEDLQRTRLILTRPLLVLLACMVDPNKKLMHVIDLVDACMAKLHQTFCTYMPLSICFSRVSL